LRQQDVAALDVSVQDLQAAKSKKEEKKERQDVSCMYLAHHELKSVKIIFITVI